MRRITVFMVLIGVLCSGCATRTRRETTKTEEASYAIYEITITAIELSNDSVGNEWHQTYVCEGESVYSGKRWRSSPNIAKRMQLSIVITETDKIPDVGEGTVTVELRDGYEVSTLVVVEENGGRYKGHKATWEIACRIKEVAVSPRTAKDIFCFSGQNAPYNCPKPRKADAYRWDLTHYCAKNFTF